MKTLDWVRNIAAKTAEEAIDLMFNQGKETVILYSCSAKRLDAEISKLYEEIRRRNADIDDINQQILPTNPYYWRDIDGCLAVECAEISGGTFAKNAESIAMFSGWNYNVLTDVKARKAPSEKAMNSLAMLGYAATCK